MQDVSSCKRGTYVCSGTRTYYMIDGHVNHGLNSFNNNTIVDWSADSAIFGNLPPIPEIAVFNAADNATNGLVITDSTDLDEVMVNIDSELFSALFQLPTG